MSAMYNRKLIFAFFLTLSLCFSSLLSAQDNLKDRTDNYFRTIMQNRSLAFDNARYEVLTDSLAIVSCNITARNGFGQTVTLPYYVILLSYDLSNGKRQTADFYIQQNPISSNLFSEIEQPFISKNEMANPLYRTPFFSKMTYEDVLYYRCMYHLCLFTADSPDWSEFQKTYFNVIKTGLWTVKNELDAFGDPVGVSLSYPFYAKRMENGTVNAEKREFFLNVSKNTICFIPGPYEFINPLDKYILTVKDSANHQLSCSLDSKLNITSNASSFLSFLDRGGIIKGIIAQEKGGRSYTFSINANGFKIAKKTANLSTNAITDEDKTIGQTQIAGTTRKVEPLSKQQEAIQKAQRLLKSRPTSKSELIKVLTSAGVTKEDATYAAEHCNADWKEEALRGAQNYLNIMAYSKPRLIRQLESNGFTREEATFAAERCGANWREQAVRSAKSVADNADFRISKSRLIKQLTHEEFSNEDATYAVERCGADWKMAARRAAEYYGNRMSLSKQDVSKQLAFENFTEEEIAYAMKNADVVWK